MNRQRILIAFAIAIGMTAYQVQAGESQLKKVEFQTEVTLTVTMNHWVYLPPNYDEKDDWPLLVFLHGAGERGDDMDKVKVHGPPKLVANGKDFPFIVVAPQCEAYLWWNADAVAQLTQSVAKQYKVDEKRIYLTGLSMGGFGTWATAAKYPQLYAAIAPICGGGNPATAEAHKSIPTWVFHGGKDTVIRPEKSEEMVTALTRAGADVRFTVYTEAEHDSWTETYDNPELYEWLLQHSK